MLTRPAAAALASCAVWAALCAPLAAHHAAAATTAPYVAPRPGDRLEASRVDVTLDAQTTATPYLETGASIASIVTDAQEPAGIVWIGGHAIGPVFAGLHLLIPGDGIEIGAQRYRVAAIETSANGPVWVTPEAGVRVVLQTCGGPAGQEDTTGRDEEYVELEPVA